MDDFFKVYDDIASRFLIYMQVSRVNTGVPRWRVQVFGLDGTHLRSGDAEVLCVEDKDREEMFKKAAVLLREREKKFKTIKQVLEEEFKKEAV